MTALICIFITTYYLAQIFREEDWKSEDGYWWSKYSKHDDRAYRNEGCGMSNSFWTDYLTSKGVFLDFGTGMVAIFGTLIYF